MTNDELETIAKEAKQKALTASSHGAMPPVTVLAYDGRVQVVVTAPRVKRDMALGVLPVLRLGCRPDEIALVMDVYVKMTKGDVADAANNYQPGALQGAVESGNRGDILDALTVTCVDRAGVLSAKVYPYTQKDGVVTYLESPDLANPDGPPAGGVPSTLKSVMAMPEMENMPGIGESMAVVGAGLSPERRRYHAGNAALNLLREMGYGVDDRRDEPND